MNGYQRAADAFREAHTSGRITPTPTPAEWVDHHLAMWGYATLPPRWAEVINAELARDIRAHRLEITTDQPSGVRTPPLPEIQPASADLTEDLRESLESLRDNSPKFDPNPMAEAIAEFGEAIVAGMVPAVEAMGRDMSPPMVDAAQREPVLMGFDASTREPAFFAYSPTTRLTYPEGRTP